VAVNAAPEESVIAPVPHLAVPAAGAGAKGRLPRGEHGVTAWIVAVLLAVLGLELMASRRRRGVSRRQWRVALALRAVIVAALVLALLEVALPRTGSGVATAFLIDASDSLGAGGKAAAVDWVKSALGHQPKGSRAGVALFGADARLELTIQQRAHLLAPAVVVDPTRTDLAGALRLAAAVLPSDARRRVVVVSDGRVTEGSVGPEARLLRSAGIQVDVHVVGQAGGPDVALRRLDAPDRVTRTDTVVLRVTLHSTSAQPGRLTIDRDGAVVLDRVVDLTPGDSVVEVAASPGPPGMHRYRAQLTAASDAVKENDSAFAVVEVVGPDRILMVEGQPGEGSQMRSALTAAGLQVDVSEPGALPTVDRLAGYQSTVLVDVDALAFTPIQVETLAAASRDLGRGLVVVGGDHSYALGGYLDSDLEKILPVTSDVKDPRRRVPVAEVLVIDTSGSMAEADTVGGQPKVDVARAAASRAVASLQPGDEVGIIAFNQSPITVLPLQKLPARSVSEAAISKLQADGGTNLYDPIVAAGNALKKSKAPLRHIIFFTDGQSDQTNLPALAADLAKQGITITVLATGQGADRHLQAVAQQGKGRYYDLVDVSKLPQILADETKTAARRLVSEGEFYPKVVSSEASVSQLQSSPPLLGYLASTAKPASRHLLEIGKDDDPLLASWRLGLGTVTSWTSDASARWSQRWATWPGYVGFWSGVVKSSFPIGGSGASVRAELIGDKVRVTLEGETPFVDGATATARVVGPDLVARTVALDRTSGTTFVGEIGATAPGGYAVAAVADGPGGPLASVTSAVARGYSPEYQPGSPDRTLLISVSKATGGRGEIGPARAFDRGTLPAGRGRAPLTGLLLLLAALAWPIDVALRRLAFHGEAREIATRQLRRARSTFIRRPPKPGTVPPGRRPAGQPDPGSPDTVGPEARPDEPAVPADAPVPASLGRLLDRTRGERSRRGGGGGPGTSGDGAG
jgi:Mg-chelatase subunit ChlD